jgi:hypothetical protein
MEELTKALENPLVWGGIVGAIAIVLLVILLRGGGRRVEGRVADDGIARARTRLHGDIRTFRDDIQRAIAACAPLFRKVETETAHGDVIGHHRREAKHRIQVRTPDLGALKQVARNLGYDSMAISELEAHWRKVERQVLEYNSGKLDNSKTPIATVKQIEKDLQSTVVLVNMCLTKYGR